MYSIQTPMNGDWQGAGGREFLDEVCRVSSEHCDADRALVFSIILYSYSDAEFRKAITDEEYWSALNEASGRFMTVFVINTPIHNPRSPFEGYRCGDYEGAAAALSMLQGLFMTEGVLTIPCILFFQVEQGQVTDGLSIPLTGRTVEEAYREVRSHIDAAIDALVELKPENKGNAEQIFTLVRNSVSSTATTKTFVRWANQAKNVFAIAKLIAQLTGHS